MPHEVEKRGSSLQYQFVAALVILILGLLMLVTWIVLYENYKSNGFSIPWWIWFFLGFGLALIIIAIIWLIIISYATSTRIHEQCDTICELRKREQESGRTFMNEDVPKRMTEAEEYPRPKTGPSQTFLSPRRY
jgi:uncharacterized membrane protein